MRDRVYIVCLLKALGAGQIRLVELAGNPLRLHCMPVKGFRCRSNSTGQIGWKSIEITLYACLVESVKLGGNPLRLHCMPVKGLRCRSNSTGQIGWKSIEITLYACLVELVKFGGNPLRLHCMPAWSNWVEIH